MSGIFISYRRDDSADYAGGLYDRLSSHFGRDYILWILIILNQEKTLG